MEKEEEEGAQSQQDDKRSALCNAAGDYLERVTQFQHPRTADFGGNAQSCHQEGNVEARPVESAQAVRAGHVVHQDCAVRFNPVACKIENSVDRDLAY